MRPWHSENERPYRAEELQERQLIQAARAYFEAERAGYFSPAGGPGRLSNKAIEDAAIAFVLEHERRAGRAARDTRHQGAPADIESEGRLIEVKASAGSFRRSGFLMLEARQLEEASRNPSFYIYLVENVAQGEPEHFKLRVISDAVLERLLRRAKERRYFEVPLTVAEYDDLPRE